MAEFVTTFEPFKNVMLQGLHRLEKYLNIQDCLEKSLKIKSAFKSTRKALKVLELYHLQEASTVFLEKNKDTTILYYSS